MSYRGMRRKMTRLDRLRGWHWAGSVKTRNWCGCEIA